MAKSRAVWGIDIGNSSLKALRLRLGSEPGQVVADAFDYIEYPKILTQPGAEPAELIQEALKQFLSRNSVRGDQVAISVSGQSGLARFVKLPPVEAKKIPDIVRFEARQQIPFDLHDVVWDYQRMGGGAEEEGFVLETEIGLFAMKRDQVLRALEPFDAAGIPVDFVQLTPLSLYNFVAFDFLQDLPRPEDYNPDDPPPSVVILSLGTDATDLVVTNGFRVWQRSIPLGGNHFTKALTKDLKLTFAKAEHLKRNATAAEDPKAVFQAMRPVFNDLLTEVQRSIGYFTSIDRAAKIDRVVALGNAMKLPGLRRYLSQSLGFDVVRIDAFTRMTGSEVTAAPAFQENLLCFGVCYGLALQGLGLGSLRTNLLPREILKERLVRQKKPWAVAAVALLLSAFAISFGSYSMALSRLDKSLFGSAEQAAQNVVSQNNQFKSGADGAIKDYDATSLIGGNLVSNVEGRVLWLEVLKAINSCLPADPEGRESDDPQDIAKRNQVFIESVQCVWIDNLAEWYASNPKEWYYLSPEEQRAAAAANAANPAGPNAAGTATPGGANPGVGNPGAANAVAGNPGAGPSRPGNAGLGNPAGPASPGPFGNKAPGGPLGTPGQAGAGGATGGPTGGGWVFELTGHHFHNTNQPTGLKGHLYIQEALLANLHSRKIKLPTPDGKDVEEVSLKELGIGCPLLVGVNKIVEYPVVNPFPSLPDSSQFFGLSEATASEPGAPDAAGLPPAEPPLARQGPRVAQMTPGPMARQGDAGRTFGAADTTQSADTIMLYRYDFVVRFCWQPTPPSKRHEKKEEEVPGMPPATPTSLSTTAPSTPMVTTNLSR
jgi:type IV pilus assembly protein PilM